jgi:hypothetical protein
VTKTNGARRVVLLGPQRFTPSVTDVRASMGITGPVALITAGWQEREADDDELSRAMGGATVNLKLHQRAEDLFRKDRPFAEAYKTRQRRLRDMQDLYRFRLGHALDTARVVSRWNADPDLVAEQREDAIDLVRRLDTAHVE